jgi:hypothetical protein
MLEDIIKMDFKRMDCEECIGLYRPNMGLAALVVVKTGMSRSGDFAGQCVYKW